MAVVTLVHVVIDTEKPLGPQVAEARRQFVPWKVIERATGYSRHRLWEFMTGRGGFKYHTAVGSAECARAAS